MWLWLFLFAQPPVPAVVWLGGSGSQEWKAGAAARGWQFLDASEIPGATDAGIRDLEAAVHKTREVDRTRIYLVGPAAGVFYAVARVPDIWAAAIALGGNPKAAIDSNRLFAANSQLVPLIWVTSEDSTKLEAAGFRHERRSALTLAQAFEYLAEQRRDAFPLKVDCETGNAAFARCYWLQITRFDAARRNEVLGASRVPPGSGASLALGPFGFDLSAAGPGVLVAFLPPQYKGPLKLGDRFVALRGREIRDARHYVETMEQVWEEGPATVMVQRGRERLRVETRIVVRPHEENLTARVRGEYSLESREVLVISRMVAEFRIQVPEQWAGCTLNWNGQELGKLEQSGCWVVGDGGVRRCD